MKKFFVFLSLNLGAVAAMAWPTIGDTTTYDLSVVQNGLTSQGELQLKVTAIDQTQDQLTLTQTTNFHGKTNSQDQQAKLSDFQNMAQQIPGLLQGQACAQNGGTTEAVTTALGSLNTCKLPAGDKSKNESGFVWVGDVVFGVVQQSITHSDTNETDTFTIKTQTPAK